MCSPTEQIWRKRITCTSRNFVYQWAILALFRFRFHVDRTEVLLRPVCNHHWAFFAVACTGIEIKSPVTGAKCYVHIDMIFSKYTKAYFLYLTFVHFEVQSNLLSPTSTFSVQLGPLVVYFLWGSELNSRKGLLDKNEVKNLFLKRIGHTGKEES